jgi:hypothetical protein
MLYLAKSAFHRGEYEIAEERLDSAMIMYQIETSSFQFWMFLQAYWIHLLSGVAVIGFAGFMSRKKILVRTINRKLASLVDEEKNLRNMMISLEKEHFVHGRYGFEEYANRMSGYEKIIKEIAENRIKYIRQIVRMIKKADALKKLSEEEAVVIRRIGDIQREYFELGKIGKRYYEKIIIGLRNEMTEIRKMTDILESGDYV